MDKCVKCHRLLPPNGKCVFCSPLETQLSPIERPSAVKIRGARLLRLALTLALLILMGLILFTDEGHYLIYRGSVWIGATTGE